LAQQTSVVQRVTYSITAAHKIAFSERRGSQSQMTNPTFGPQFDIDHAAQRYISETLAANWILRERRPDVFLDYEFEQRVAGEPTGRTAYIQLKGQATRWADSTHTKVVMETKHLRYYRNAVRVPCFVILVDTEKRRAHYLFVQPWLEQNVDRLESQTTLTLPIPLANELENHPRLNSDFNRAIAWMGDRFPGMPEAAVSSIEKFYEALDDRFSVQVTAKSSGRTVEVRGRAAAAEVSMNVTGIKREQLPEIMRALDWGKAFQVADVNVSAKGSPLFEELCKPGRGTVSWKPSVELRCSMTFEVSYKRKRSSLVLHAKLTSGSKGLSIESDVSGCPIHAELLLFSEKTERGLRAQLNLQLRAAAWVQVDLLSAPRRESVTSFVAAIEGGSEVSLRISTDSGEFKIKVPRNAGNFEALKARSDWFRLISDAALVAQRYGLAPKIPAPASITEHDVAALSFGYDTLHSNSIRRPWVNVLSKESSTGVERITHDLETKGQVCGWFQAAFPCIIELFGCEKQIGVIEVEPTYCRVLPTLKPITGYRQAFRIARAPRGSLMLRIRREGGDKSTLGMEPGEFHMETDEGAETGSGR
jgi:hypothetical protein